MFLEVTLARSVGHVRIIENHRQDEVTRRQAPLGLGWRQDVATAEAVRDLVSEHCTAKRTPV